MAVATSMPRGKSTSKGLEKKMLYGPRMAVAPKGTSFSRPAHRVHLKSDQRPCPRPTFNLFHSSNSVSQGRDCAFCCWFSEAFLKGLF